jgi:glutaredoxin
MSSHHVVLYASGDCAHCRAARAALTASGHPYEERDPLESLARLKELMLVSASASVPTIVVSGKVLVGFDPVLLDEMLREPPPEPDVPEDDPFDDDPDDDDSSLNP